MTILGPDDPGKRKIGFTMCERNGVKIYPYDSVGHLSGIDPGRLWPILAEDGLREGTKVLVPGLMGGYHVMTVERDEHGVLSAKDEHLTAILKYGEDERGCWTCVALMNLRGVAKLDLLKLRSR